MQKWKIVCDLHNVQNWGWDNSSQNFSFGFSEEKLSIDNLLLTHGYLVNNINANNYTSYNKLFQKLFHNWFSN